MIDNFTILFSTLVTLFIIVRAATLDRVLPWFETKALHEQAKKQEAAAREAAQRRLGGPNRPQPRDPAGPRR
ncbi:hypothetical protein [Limobrevibacterium gyesilva]|uniref:Uncharacterized protein n=1 Tax=Limobrevibacterium gyesilva TaxID=2991712 RepID=A0AA41YRB9_9PROT|nr:hypothetical protein [Limobrevibacterium gyesilva]MCW3476878.1 hypothetical protein [Limobrevibacterium gyesilva]